MSVSVQEVLLATRSRKAAVTGETAGYLVLGAADQLGNTEGRLGAVHLAEDGRITLGRLAPGTAEELEADLRALLRELLECGPPASPALARAARGGSGGGTGRFIGEMESALIPVNRAAARRALARLHRDVVRAKEKGLPAAPPPEPPPPRETSAPAVLVAQPVSPPAVSIPAAAPAPAPVAAPVAPPPVAAPVAPPPGLRAPVVATRPPVPARKPSLQPTATAEPIPLVNRAAPPLPAPPDASSEPDGMTLLMAGAAVAAPRRPRESMFALEPEPTPMLGSVETAVRAAAVEHPEGRNAPTPAAPPREVAPTPRVAVADVGGPLFSGTPMVAVLALEPTTIERATPAAGGTGASFGWPASTESDTERVPPVVFVDEDDELLVAAAPAPGLALPDAEGALPSEPTGGRAPEPEEVAAEAAAAEAAVDAGEAQRVVAESPVAVPGELAVTNAAAVGPVVVESVVAENVAIDVVECSEPEPAFVSPVALAVPPPQPAAPAAAEPSPSPTEEPYRPRKSDISELLAGFMVGESRSLGELSRELQRMAGVGATPEPPGLLRTGARPKSTTSR